MSDPPIDSNGQYRADLLIRPNYPLPIRAAGGRWLSVFTIRTRPGVAGNDLTAIAPALQSLALQILTQLANLQGNSIPSDCIEIRLEASDDRRLNLVFDSAECFSKIPFVLVARACLARLRTRLTGIEEIQGQSIELWRL